MANPCGSFLSGLSPLRHGPVAKPPVRCPLSGLAKRVLFLCICAAFVGMVCAASAAERCIVIDPGHGGARDVDESSANNATSPSGVKEKDLTLAVGREVFEAI